MSVLARPSGPAAILSFPIGAKKENNADQHLALYPQLAQVTIAYVTVGDTPVTHDDYSVWLCEMNVNSDDCIHGMHALVETARNNGAELSVELAYAGRGNRPNADGSPTAVVSAERPVSPELNNLRTMDRADMDYMRALCLAAVTVPCDGVVLAAGMRGKSQLADSFMGLTEEFEEIGDCVRARTEWATPYGKMFINA